MLGSSKIVLLLGLIYLCRAAEEDVLELTDSDFSSAIAQHDTALVMFYAPWCGHCKRLKPEYALAAGVLKDDDPPVALAKVDCTEGGKSTCEQFSVSGYPTLKIFRNGEVSQEYNGPRESNGIVKYMRAQVGPSSKDLLTVESFENMLAKDEVVVVGFFEKESDLKGQFLKTADKMREEVSFAHSSAADVLKKAGYKNNVVLYRPKRLQNKFEESFVEYKGEPESLKAFIKENYHGLVGIRQKENINDFSNPLVVAYYDVDYVKNAKGTNYWRNRVLKVAKEMTEVTFAISDKDDFTHELNDYGIDFAKGDKPVVAGKDTDGNKFVMSNEFSIENLLAFAKDLVDGKLEPFIKSEALPASNDGPVKVAVGKNFKELVTDSGRDALIEFYAPWCGHCQKLAPIWEELGEKLKDEEVDIIKIDATANDWPKSLYDVSGFPTIYWKPKDSSKKPVRYNGGRALEDFLKYVSDQASSELKGWDRKGNVKDELLFNSEQIRIYQKVPSAVLLPQMVLSSKYMRAQVGPSSKDLLTVESFENILAKDEVVVIGFFEKESDLKGQFLKTADKMREGRNVSFAHSSAADVLKKAGYKNNVVLYRPKRLQNKFEESFVEYKGEPESLKAFIKENYHGLVGIRQKQNINDFSNPLVVAYYDVDYVKNAKGTNYWRNRVLKVAKEMTEVTFAISDKDNFTHELNNYGIDFVKGDKPVVAGKDTDGNKFVMSNEFSIENLLAFAKDLVDGKLEPFIKSEALPASNDGPVKVAVGKNFKELVTDSGRDALIKFYAPWCEHCQKLAPVWEELGEKLKNEEVDIIKIDATANDLPKSLYTVYAFPTIYWKPKDSSMKPVRYKGGRALEDFLKYVSDQASSELKGWDRKGNVKDEL
ncbi:protein disulfide-isomerase A3 [Aricia agestis]|nr:protein disulfide-isomerase A3 [Aricia agestis]